MSTPGVNLGEYPGTLGREDDPLVTVGLRVKKSQPTALDQLVDAAHTRRAALVREAIERPLTPLKHPHGWRTEGVSATGIRRPTPESGQPYSSAPCAITRRQPVAVFGSPQAL